MLRSLQSLMRVGFSRPKKTRTTGKEWRFYGLVRRWISARIRNYEGNLLDMSHDVMMECRFHFSPTWSFSTPTKSLKTAQSDNAIRPRFHIGSDAFSTPSSTTITPSSWPPRPDSTGLRPTCVAGHVVSFHAWKSSMPLKPHVVTHVVMSLSPSWIVVKAREHERDVVFVFRKTGPCVLKHRIVQKNHLNFTI